MMFPAQAAAAAKAKIAAASAGGVLPAPTTDSWDNEPVPVSLAARFEPCWIELGLIELS